MPQIKPGVPPPFDQGVFLVHYNRGREAFQEGRYAEARRELEAAQKMRPDDADVLNLLGLVYFKTNAYPEAEVIYRRLVVENPNVFILHSNLGLIYFKQGKLEEAEKYLIKAVELRPNYSKSHLYLGLLYKQKKKYGLALEHLRFAGAEKAVRELEQEQREQMTGAPRGSRTSSVTPPPPPNEPPAAAPVSDPFPQAAHAAVTPDTAVQTMPGSVPTPHVTTQRVRLADVVAAGKAAAGRAGEPAESLPQQPAAAESRSSATPPLAASRLQQAVDEEAEPFEEKRLDLASRRIEGASKTFTLHENGFLEINFARNVHVKRGTISSYSGNLRFSAESGLLGTTAATLVKAEGQGKLFVYEKGRKTFLLDLNEEFIYVEGSNLLALEDSLSYRVEPIYDSNYQTKIDIVKIFGKGSLAISTSIEPLTLRVNRQYPLSISSNALVAWTGNLIPTVIDDGELARIMIETAEAGFKIRFEGDGVVVSEQ